MVSQLTQFIRDIPHPYTILTLSPLIVHIIQVRSIKQQSKFWPVVCWQFKNAAMNLPIPLHDVILGIALRIKVEKFNCNYKFSSMNQRLLVHDLRLCCWFSNKFVGEFCTPLTELWKNKEELFPVMNLVTNKIPNTVRILLIEFEFLQWIMCWFIIQHQILASWVCLGFRVVVPSKNDLLW